MPKPQNNRARDRPTFLEDFKQHTKRIKCKPCQCRWIYIVFLLVVLVAIVLQVRMGRLLPGRFELPSEEGIICVKIFTLVTLTLLAVTPAAFIGMYCKVPEKYYSMVVMAVLAGCVCFSLSGVINSIYWLQLDMSGRLETMLEYSRKEFAGKRRIPSLQKFIEMEHECCGLTDFMDYPLGIFRATRVPDYCCTDYEKGCGKFIFYDTPLAFTRIRPSPEPPVPKVPCLLTTEVWIEQLPDILNAQLNASEGSRMTLINEFNTEGINEEVQCNDMTLSNFLDPQCITTKEPDGEFYSYKYRWCFALFYKDAPRVYAKKMNDLLHLVKANSCYSHLQEFTDNVIRWVLIGMGITGVLTFIVFMAYIKYYEKYRLQHVKIFPLPLWYHRLPEETEEMIPPGLGRICHVNDVLALTSEKEAKAYLRKHPKFKKAALAHMKKEKAKKVEPKEAIPRAALIQHPHDGPGESHPQPVVPFVVATSPKEGIPPAALIQHPRDGPGGSPPVVPPVVPVVVATSAKTLKSASGKVPPSKETIPSKTKTNK